MCTETITLYTRCLHQVRAHEPCRLKSMHMVNHAASLKPQGGLDDHCPECKTPNGAGRAASVDGAAGASATAAQPPTGASLVGRLLARRQEKRRKREADREAQLNAKMREYLPEPFPLPDEKVFDVLLGHFNPLQFDDDFDTWQKVKAEADKERSEGQPREG